MKTNWICHHCEKQIELTNKLPWVYLKGNKAWHPECAFKRSKKEELKRIECQNERQRWRKR